MTRDVVVNRDGDCSVVLIAILNSSFRERESLTRQRILEESIGIEGQLF